MKIIKATPADYLALQKTLRKNFGDEEVYFLGDKAKTSYPVTTTGSYSLDYVTGNRGTVDGRIIEIYGPESSGKTTLALQLAKTCLLLGGKVAYIDVEHALDVYYASKMAVPVDQILFSQPDSAEKALQLVSSLVSSGLYNLVFFDSVAAAITNAEMNSDADEFTVGSLARLMSKELKKLVALTSRTGTTVVFINQERDKISMGGPAGAKTTTPGGRALRFYSSLRLEIKKTGQIVRNGEKIGITSRIQAIKNKTAPPYRICEVEILFDEVNRVYGFWQAADIFRYAARIGKVIGSRSKNYKMINGTIVNLGDGEMNSKYLLHQDFNLLQAIRADLNATLEKASEEELLSMNPVALEDDEDDVDESELSDVEIQDENGVKVEKPQKKKGRKPGSKNASSVKAPPLNEKEELIKQLMLLQASANKSSGAPLVIDGPLPIEVPSLVVPEMPKLILPSIQNVETPSFNNSGISSDELIGSGNFINGIELDDQHPE